MAQQSSDYPDRKGSCLCGAIQIHIKGGEAPLLTNLCHCSSCQKASGSVYVALVVFKADQVTYTATPPSLLRDYEDTTPESGSVLTRSFCGHCGSYVRGTKRPGGEGFVVVPLGAIDGEEAKAQLKPTVEYFCVRRVPWLAEVEGAESFPKLPGTAPAPAPAPSA